MSNISRYDNTPLPPLRLHPRVGQRYRFTPAREEFRCVGMAKLLDGTEVVLTDPLRPYHSSQDQEGEWESVEHFLKKFNAGDYETAPMPAVEILARDRAEGKVVKVLQEKRERLTITRVEDDQFAALESNGCVTLLFGYLEISEPDVAKVKVGAALWVVTALEQNRYGGRQHCRRIIFEELPEETP